MACHNCYGAVDCSMADYSHFSEAVDDYYMPAERGDDEPEVYDILADANGANTNA